MTEESNMNLLSNSPDEFLSQPNTEVEVRKIKPPKDERNVCVVVSLLENDSNLLQGLVSKLNRLCAFNQKLTATHTVALLFLIKESNVLNRLGYCDELTASNIVFRLCRISEVNATVYREYGTVKERPLTEEDLEKRPFKF